MATAKSDFERNVAAYQRELPSLLQRGVEGKFVLVRAGEVRLDAFFGTRDEARREGHSRFGLDEFHVKEVVRGDFGAG